LPLADSLSGADCPCSPNGTFLDPTNVFVSTTGLALPFQAANFQGVDANIEPDVCIIRVLISRQLEIDVDLNGIYNFSDVIAITSTNFYQFGIYCGYDCGRPDVNKDGYVSSEDATLVLQALPGIIEGVDIHCGGIYATDFSCGSSMAAPETISYGISIDNILYFQEGGSFESKRRSAEREQLVDLVHEMRRDLNQTMKVLAETMRAMATKDKELAARDAVIASLADVAHVRTLKQELERRLRESDVQVQETPSGLWALLLLLPVALLVIPMAIVFFAKRERQT